ncbi:MAG: DNA alkylation repair protein [Nitrospiraceae bacterium]|nr:DNA alkylation repair protein [Nitrospiraceae bacterium]
MKEIVSDLMRLASPEKAAILSRFFRTGKGEYGEGDIFLGITAPQQRKVAIKYRAASFDDLQQLLASNIHEYRLVALFILTEKYDKSDKTGRKDCVDFFLQNLARVNSWDLVDLSSGRILGDYLLDRDKRILYRLAVSENLWERRISIISTFSFIRKDRFDDTLKIAGILLNDRHDLIHKAVGWMLREIGKRDLAVEESFLKSHCRTMPRTMLRYAIERFDEKKRRFYLGK